MTSKTFEENVQQTGWCVLQTLTTNTSTASQDSLRVGVVAAHAD